MTNPDNTLKERLAAIEHERWAAWQQWVFEQYGIFNEDGSFTISADRVKNMERQIALPYSELTRDEQLSDIREVDRYWPLVMAWHQKQVKAAVREARILETRYWIEVYETAVTQLEGMHPQYNSFTQRAAKAAVAGFRTRLKQLEQEGINPQREGR